MCGIWVCIMYVCIKLSVPLAKRSGKFVCVCVCVCVCHDTFICVACVCIMYIYGVALVSRIDTMIGLFCKRAL